MNAFLSVLFVVLVACNSQNNNIQAQISTNAVKKPIENSNTNTIDATEPKTQKANVATFSYDNHELLSRTDFECKIFVYEGSLVMQLLKDKEEINISLGGTQLYGQKPYSGSFTLSPQDNETTAMVSIHVNNPKSGEKITAPMFFDGKATFVQFNKDEIQIDIDALGGFYGDMDNTANWKPIKGHVRAKNPMFSGTDKDLQKLFY